MMTKYRDVTLQDITYELSDGLHAAPEFYPDGEYIFVNAKNLVNGRIVDCDKDKKTSYDEYLKYQYGNYMQLPPEDQRENRHRVIEVKF